MNKREYRNWRRRLRADARRRRLAELNDPFRGSYDESFLDPVIGWINYDQLTVKRSPKHGDFHTTTPYKLEKYTRTSNNVTQFRWDRPSTKSSGTTGCGIEPEFAAWWGGYSFTKSNRLSLLAASQRAIVARVLKSAATWDVLTDVAELRDSVSMLTKSASWFYQFARLVRVRDAKGVLQHMNILPTKKKVYHVRGRLIVDHKYGLGKTGVDVFTSMSNVWMSYRYGVMPMIYSMRDAFRAITANVDLMALTWKEQATLKEHAFYLPVYKQVDNGSGLLYTLGKSYTADGSIRHRAYITFQEDLSVRLGLSSFSSLVNTLYEAAPLSFVLDWFVDIGSYLRGLGLSKLLKTSYVNTTEKGTLKIQGWYSYSSKQGWSHKPIKSLTGGVSSSFYFERSKGNLSSPLPTFDPWYNWKRSLDTVSLSWQRTKKYIHS